MNNKIRRMVSKLKKRLIHNPAVSIPFTYLGSAYGGWPVVEELLDEEALVLSFGLGTDISFDLAIIERLGCTVIGFDPTPKSIEWIMRQSLPNRFSYHQWGIAAMDGEAEFFPPERDGFTSFSSKVDPARTQAVPIKAPVRRLATILKDLSLPTPDVLKMDIEGFEYDVLRDILSTPIRPRQVLVEFHHTMYGIQGEETRAAVSQLEASGYKLFYVSDGGLEYGFLMDA
ncbi:FkbM family methyltransferase [Rhizobium terrae]|uniref:FkbM family methyltransferase n=1 Tax=Rhizobium terrae TaxID=2171756 RepID=UPI000E3BB946|nr:FkbM family methyltransferase [Rhizobium terrae]